MIFESTIVLNIDSKFYRLLRILVELFMLLKWNLGISNSLRSVRKVYKKVISIDFFEQESEKRKPWFQLLFWALVLVSRTIWSLRTQVLLKIILRSFEVIFMLELFWHFHNPSHIAFRIFIFWQPLRILGFILIQIDNGHNSFHSETSL